MARQPPGRAEIAGDAALQHRQEVRASMAKAVADDYLRRIPKAELHCHLAGTCAPPRGRAAARAGLALPRPADKLYQWPDFYGFLDVLRLTALVLRTPEDFARAVYEYVEDAMRDGNLRHVEFFFNPDYFYPNGIDYPSMVDGMIEGVEAAQEEVRRVEPADLLHRPLDQLAGPGGRDRRDGDRPSPRPCGRHRPGRRRTCRAAGHLRRGLCPGQARRPAPPAHCSRTTRHWPRRHRPTT